MTEEFNGGRKRPTLGHDDVLAALGTLLTEYLRINTLLDRANDDGGRARAEAGQQPNVRPHPQPVTVPDWSLNFGDFPLSTSIDRVLPAIAEVVEILHSPIPTTGATASSRNGSQTTSTLMSSTSIGCPKRLG